MTLRMLSGYRPGEYAVKICTSPKIKILLLALIVSVMIGCSGIDSSEAEVIAANYVQKNIGPIEDFVFTTKNTRYGWLVEISPTKEAKEKYLNKKYFPLFIEVSDKGNITGLI